MLHFLKGKCYCSKLVLKTHYRGQHQLTTAEKVKHDIYRLLRELTYPIEIYVKMGLRLMKLSSLEP